MNDPVLLTDSHVERCITLLALQATAINPVELARYIERRDRLLRDHPELADIHATDLRVAAKIVELRDAFEQPSKPAELCYKCGHLTSGHRRDFGDGKGMLPVCTAHLNQETKQFRKQKSIDYGDAGEYHGLRGR